MSTEDTRHASDIGQFIEFQYPGDLGYTNLENIFITHFVRHADGSAVKVFLVALSKCFGGKDHQWAGLKRLAEEAGVSKNTAIKALRYWESVGLIRIIKRWVKDPHNQADYKTAPDSEYRIPTSSIVQFTDMRRLNEEIAFERRLAELEIQRAKQETAVGEDPSSNSALPLVQKMNHPQFNSCTTPGSKNEPKEVPRSRTTKGITTKGRTDLPSRRETARYYADHAVLEERLLDESPVDDPPEDLPTPVEAPAQETPTEDPIKQAIAFIRSLSTEVST
jgi:hypothetical protein